MGKRSDSISGLRRSAILLVSLGTETSAKIMSEMDRELASVRRRMSAEQIALIQKQFLQRKLLEAAELPRLSLFYL